MGLPKTCGNCIYELSELYDKNHSICSHFFFGMGEHPVVNRSEAPILECPLKLKHLAEQG